MPNKVAKAYAINDAKIMFVSLVGKAANKHQFLITKSEDGKSVQALESMFPDMVDRAFENFFKKYFP